MTQGTKPDCYYGWTRFTRILTGLFIISIQLEDEGKRQKQKS